MTREDIERIKDEYKRQQAARRDCISRQAAIDALTQCPKHCIDVFHGYHISIEDAEASIIKLPSVQPEQKKGKWEQVEIYYLEEMDGKAKPSAIASMFCPVCHRYHNEVYFYGDPTEYVNYCSYCGAKMMRGEQE